MPSVQIRFYQELNEFLRPGVRFASIQKEVYGSPSVKDLIESCGVPHTEVDLIVVNGESVGFDVPIQGGERIAVYPVFEGLDISPVQRLRPEPLRNPKFVVDANAGRLARLLRMLGFDTLFRSDYTDSELVDISVAERRIILTRDRGVLMRRRVTHGYYLRSSDPDTQAAEVLRRLDLMEGCAPLTRCMNCNGQLREVPWADIRDRIPELSRTCLARKKHPAGLQCESCGQAYWQGSHSPHLAEHIEKLKKLAVDLEVPGADPR